MEQDGTSCSSGAKESFPNLSLQVLYHFCEETKEMGVTFSTSQLTLNKGDCTDFASFELSHNFFFGEELVVRRLCSEERVGYCIYSFLGSSAQKGILLFGSFQELFWLVTSKESHAVDSTRDSNFADSTLFELRTGKIGRLVGIFTNSISVAPRTSSCILVGLESSKNREEGSAKGEKRMGATASDGKKSGNSRRRNFAGKRKNNIGFCRFRNEANSDKKGKESGRMESQPNC